MLVFDGLFGTAGCIWKSHLVIWELSFEWVDFLIPSLDGLKHLERVTCVCVCGSFVQ